MRNIRSRLSLFIYILLFVSCTGKPKKHFTIDLNFTCVPALYFDQLNTVRLTNDKSDAGGQGDGLSRLFEADRIYLKNLPKKNGHFYIDNVENSQYRLLLVECDIEGTWYHGVKKYLDFSENTSDTLLLDICLEPNISYKSE